VTADFTIPNGEPHGLGSTACIDRYSGKSSLSDVERRTDHRLDCTVFQNQSRRDHPVDTAGGGLTTHGNGSMSTNPGTIKLLVEWARWGSMQNIGYPTMSPMFGERALKAPLYGAGYIPPDVMLVEQCVCRIEWQFREIIIQRYQRKRTFVQIGRDMGISRWAARGRLNRAESAVHHEISKRSCSHAPTEALSVRRSKSVSA
jgi:hypothetical protein